MVEVILDLENFFDSSVDFIQVSVEKMRKTHGPSFNFNTVKALLALRQGMSKSDKESVLKECKEILDSFKSEDFKGIQDGIFSNIDT